MNGILAHLEPLYNAATKTFVFVFVSSITTQQFNKYKQINNHTSSSTTTHQFIERKLHVAAGKIATNTLVIFDKNV